MIKETRWVGVSDKRFWIIAALLMVIFLVFMAFLYLKADEITRDPCSICAEAMLESNVVCTTSGYQPITRTYFSNGSITQSDRY